VKSNDRTVEVFGDRVSGVLPRSFRRDIAHYATGASINFIGDEGEDRVRAAYGDEKYSRLAAIKGEWDPTNVFKGNQNINPA
jgi:hypothetical protein